MIIQAQKLSKVYANEQVIGPLNIEISKGQIFGLLGPNAAGKSTTIRMLAGIIKPNDGRAVLMGLDLLKKGSEIKKHIGYVSQHFGLYAELSVLENIRFYARLYGVVDEERFEYLLQKYKLQTYRDTKSGELSGGYQRRLSLVCALAHDPELLFLDEPTAGIDPLTRKRIWDVFYTLVSEGKTLFITTHYMEEAERCNEIAFLNHGKIIAKGSPKAIQNSLVDYDIYFFENAFEHTMLDFLNQQEEVVLINQFGNEIRIIILKSLHEDRLKALMKPYVEGEIILKKTDANLEDVFIALTQEK